jgi:hypothetical protein
VGILITTNLLYAYNQSIVDLILFIKLKLLNISITTKAAAATPKTTSTKTSVVGTSDVSATSIQTSNVRTTVTGADTAGTTTAKTPRGNKTKHNSGHIAEKQRC